MKPVHPALIGLLALSCLIGGCTSRPSAAPHADAASTPDDSDRPTSLLIAPADAQALGYSLHWSSHLAVAEGHRLTAVEVLGDLLVAVEQPSRLIRAAAVDSGNPVWSRVVAKPDDPLFHPFRRNELVFINSETTVFALNARSGRLVSVGQLPYVATTGPVLLGNRAVFGSAEGVVFSFDLRSSNVNWRYQMSGAILTPPVRVGDNVLVGDERGMYRLLNGEDGESIWGGRTFGPIAASPATDATSIYVPSDDTVLYALSRNTGRDRWVYHAGAPLQYAPRVFERTVLLPVPGNGLVALDAVEGRERWRTRQPARPILTRNDRVLIAQPDGLSWVELDNGRAAVTVPTAPLAGVFLGPEQSLILVGRDGRILRLNPSR